MILFLFILRGCGVHVFGKMYKLTLLFQSLFITSSALLCMCRLKILKNISVLKSETFKIAVEKGLRDVKPCFFIYWHCISLY